MKSIEFPYRPRKRVKYNGGEMTAHNIITTKMEPTPWVSSFTYAHKANGNPKVSGFSRISRTP